MDRVAKEKSHHRDIWRMAVADREQVPHDTLEEGRSGEDQKRLFTGR